MDIKELFTGVAVVIDDKIDDENANISHILEQIKAANIPMIKYCKLPNDNIIAHFQSISFLILDWELETSKSSSTLDKYNKDMNIEFIKKLNERCLCPIFIFTNGSTSDIGDWLRKAGLMVRDAGKSNIFIQSKAEIIENDSLLNKISIWIQNNSSIYVLKKWETEYQKCKTKLFHEFNEINPDWPKIMWKNFEDDSVNKPLELSMLISRNIHSRMTPFKFSTAILDTEEELEKDVEELRRVIEGTMFIKNENLSADDIGTGDLFIVENQNNGEQKYYLNIRAQCDLLRKEKKLYVISGYAFNQDEEPKVEQGQYIEKINQAIVAFIDGGKIIDFKFAKFNIKSWNELKALKALRIGRLLPPYINRIQQRFSLYMQRQGLPRIPDDAIFLKTHNISSKK